jgi:hypothetical protein
VSVVIFKVEYPPSVCIRTHVLARISYAWKHFWKLLSKSPLCTTVTVSEWLKIIQHDTLRTRFLVYEIAKIHMRLNQSSTVDILISIFLSGPKSFYRQWYVRLRTVKIKNPLTSQTFVFLHEYASINVPYLKAGFFTGSMPWKTNP